MAKYKPIIAQVLTDDLCAKMRPVDKLVVEYIRRGRQAAFDQAAQINRIAELHTRAIFLGGGGRIPESLKAAVQEVVMPSGEPITGTGDGETNGG